MTDTTHTFAPRHLVAMTIYAQDLARAYPRASAEALADKLLTVFEGACRGARLTVAEAAMRAVSDLAAA